MPYSDSAFTAGRLFPQSSRTPNDTPSLRSGELASNAADGVMYVGKTDGTAGMIPGAVGIKQIVKLTQAQYDAITATASATTLYIITAS